MRSAIYCRVSTRRQTCDVQLEQTRSFISARGWTVFEEYVEAGVSGVSTRRPQLDRLMNDARKRRFDVLVVVKLDRLGRSLVHLIGLLNELRELSIDFVSVSQTIDTSTSSGKLLLNLLASIAEFERSLIRERVIAGIEYARSQGVRLGRKPLNLDEKLVREVHARTQSVRETARELHISRSTVFRVLKGKRMYSCIVGNSAQATSPSSGSSADAASG